MRSQWLLLSAAALLVASTLPSSARAQAATQATVETKAKSGQKAVNAGLMGKQGINAGAAKAVTPAPEAKGGPKTRGAQGTIRVDNRTNWYIDVYVDSQYRGQVGPWGDIYLYNACGVTRLYAEAPGTDFYWGPQSGDFCSTTWTLTN